MRTEQTNIKVIVRVRPYNSRELEQNQRCIIKVMDQQTLLFDPDVDDDEFFFQGTKQNFRDITKRVHKKLSMAFDRVFDTDSTNQQIFEECTSPLVDSVLNGYNCSVFVYGATGAGKTFTMLGNDNWHGLTYLTMRDLFEKLEAQSEMRKFNVAVSYLEVYNEQVMNLLTKTGPLKLQEDSTGVAVSGLTPKPIFSAEELLSLLKIGNENRTQHPTDANAESSRSHAVFQVHIRITDRKTDIKRTVKLSMIDLAGSERAASTKGIGLRFREGANINKSLLALGNCINKLADGLKHIPYRDSNLTRILKDSLGGNCQTLMVANVSMSSLTYEDTYNTLKYASRAKKIRTTLRQNALKTNMPKDFYIKKVDELMTENNRLKELQKTLEAKLAAALQQNANNTTQQISTTTTNMTSSDEIDLQNWYYKIDAAYSNVIKIQDHVLGLRKKGRSYCVKLKEYAERYQKILSHNKPLLKEDVETFNASMNSIEKDIEKHCEEQSLWNKKFQDTLLDLEKLNKLLKSSKSYQTLNIYKKYKDREIQSNFQNAVNDIAKDVVVEFKRLRTTFTLSCEILQKYTNDFGIEVDMKRYLDELLQVLHSKMNPATIDDGSNENVKILINGKRIHPKTTTAAAAAAAADEKLSFNSNCRKIQKTLDFDTDSGILGLNDDSADNTNEFNFKMPAPSKKSRNIDLNETHSLLPSTSGSTTDWNKTFEMTTGCSSTSINHITPYATSTPSEDDKKILKKKNFVKNILSENIVHLPQSKKFIENGLMKAQNFGPKEVTKTMAIGMQKENKKHSPHRIRKSPRPNVSKATVSSTTKTKHSTMSSGPAPIVRTNRAASFRTKK